MSDANFVDGLPARLNVSQTAKLLGFSEHDVPVLMAAKLLDPLGSPAANSPKYFARIAVLEHANDLKWLDRATRAVAKYWQNKRARRSDVPFTKSRSEYTHDDPLQPSVKSSVT